MTQSYTPETLNSNAYTPAGDRCRMQIDIDSNGDATLIYDQEGLPNGKMELEQLTYLMHDLATKLSTRVEARLNGHAAIIL